MHNVCQSCHLLPVDKSTEFPEHNNAPGSWFISVSHLNVCIFIDAPCQWILKHVVFIR